MNRLTERVKKENLYLSNGVIAIRTEPDKDGFRAYLKRESGEVEIEESNDYLNKFLIGEDGDEVSREEYFTHRNPQRIL